MPKDNMIQPIRLDLIIVDKENKIYQIVTVPVDHRMKEE